MDDLSDMGQKRSGTGIRGRFERLEVPFSGSSDTGNGLGSLALEVGSFALVNETLLGGLVDSGRELRKGFSGGLDVTSSNGTKGFFTKCLDGGLTLTIPLGADLGLTDSLEG